MSLSTIKRKLLKIVRRFKKTDWAGKTRKAVESANVGTGPHDKAVRNAMDGTGWSRNEAEKEISASVSELGITYAYYNENKLWNYSIEEQKTYIEWKKSGKGRTPERFGIPAVPDQAFGGKINKISNKGVQVYWKKLERTTGYELYRSYQRDTGYECIAVIRNRRKGMLTDADFDHSQKKLFYKVRSFLEQDDGRKTYSDFTDVFFAVYREHMEIERIETFLYSGTERSIRVLYGWGEVADPEWRSDDDRVAVISRDGVISARGKGECTLTCTSRSIGESRDTTVIVDRDPESPIEKTAPRFTFDPKDGIWRNRDAEPTGNAVVMMTGDLMCGSAQMKTQRTAAGCDMRDSFDCIRDTIRSADLSIANLETLLASGWPYMTDEAFIDGYNNCNASPRYLDAVRHGGFDVLMMANNHNCDGGIRALKETVDRVHAYGFAHTGAFNSKDDKRFLLVDVNGIKIGLLAYMSRFTGFNFKNESWPEEEQNVRLNVFSYERAAEDIRQLKEAGAEFVITYMHWGLKNFFKILPKQVKEAKEVANAGADLIIGANPHVLQPFRNVETDSGKIVPCFYSLGNFQAIMKQIPENRDSVIVRIELSRKEDGSVVLVSRDYIPCHTFTKINGCRWAPVALNEPGTVRVPSHNKKRFTARIENIVGFNSEQHRYDALRAVMNDTGWSQTETLDNMNEVCNREGISYSEFAQQKRGDACKKEQAARIRNCLNDGTDIPAEFFVKRDAGLCDEFMTAEQRSAVSMIQAGELTLRTLTKYMKTTIPEEIKRIDADITGQIETMPERLAEGSILLCTNKQSITPEKIRAANPLCVIGAPRNAQALRETGVSYIPCRYVRSYLIDVAAAWRRQFAARSVAVIGGKGRISVSRLICAAAGTDDTICIGEEKNKLDRIAKDVLRIRNNTDLFIRELTCTRMNVIEKATYMIHPDLFVILSADTAHPDRFEDDKELLINELDAMDRHAAPGALGIVNCDAYALGRIPYQHKVVRIGIGNAEAEIAAENVTEADGSVTFEIRDGERTTAEIELHQAGRQDVYHALAAFAAGRYFGLDESSVTEAIEKAYEL